MIRIVQLNLEEVIHASHFIPHHKGKCKHLHGHSYTIQVSIAGIYNKTMLVDFGHIKDLIRRFDHSYLNKTFKYPSAENMSRYFALKILRLNKNIIDVTVTVWETEKSSATTSISKGGKDER